MMLLDELYDHYGTWAEMSRRLDLGSCTYRTWKKTGYIPFKMQLFIEHETNGIFKASKEHAAPEKKRRTARITTKK